MIFRALIFSTVICLENVAGATTTTEFWPGKDCPVDESIGNKTKSLLDAIIKCVQSFQGVQRV